MNNSKTLTSLGNQYHALIWKEEDWYVTRCVEIELASQGKTKKQALKNLNEALCLLLEDEEKSIKLPSFRNLELRSFIPSPACYAQTLSS